MRTLSATFTYSANGGEEKEFECELDGSQNAEEIKEAIAELENGEDVDGMEYTAALIELTDVACDEDTDGNDTLENIFSFAEAYCNCDQDAEVVNAAIKLGIDGDDIDEAYQGTAKDDAEFVQELCESCGDVPELPGYIYIDWERTAHDVMMDYSEQDGHYFRNM